MTAIRALLQGLASRVHLASNRPNAPAQPPPLLLALDAFFGPAPLERDGSARAQSYR